MIMKRLLRLFLISIFLISQSFNYDSKRNEKNPVIVWQPSHQTDTGKDFSEAATCNAIIEAAIKQKPHFREYKVWSLGRTDVHHADSGSNTKIEHTTAIIDNKISGYAYELQKANKYSPQVFIAVHNNGGTKRNAVWGYIHYGDKFEQENSELAARLTKAISSATNLEDRGVWLDSTTGRNDYRCKTTGKLSFYSLDENINSAPYRVLLEVGDNAASRDLLTSSEGQKTIGIAIKKELTSWLRDKKLK
jgi:N-acetylmuramoyl-L-alanine amidase